jgi:hypothetical protein
MPSASAKVEKSNPWAVLFFALFFFLCCADFFFVTRVRGFNLRWGQLLLLGLAIVSMPSLIRYWRDSAGSRRFLSSLILCWLPFFLFYALAAFYSQTPQATFLKWGWAVFNIGGAILVCLNSQWGPAFEKGFVFAVLAVAGLIWFQTLAVYWFGFMPGPVPGHEAISHHIPGLPWLPLGHMQESFQYLGNTYFRPNAYYYEPSYAGCALSFVLPLLMALFMNRNSWKSTFVLAAIFTAIFFCSSRAGLLAAVLSLVYIGLHAFFQKRKEILFLLLRVMLISFLMVAVFAISPTGRNYCHFMIGPLGADTAQRVVNPQSSEGARLVNIGDCISLWSNRLILGNGVIRLKGKHGQGLSQISMNTWLEIGVESGILGFSTFLFAILGSVLLALKHGRKSGFTLFMIAAWLSHFTVCYNFSQTFPRLDYWLFFFLSIRLLIIPLARSVESRQKENLS